MSDMRFIVAGVALSFAALVAFGTLSSAYFDAIAQASEFEECRDYDNPGSAMRDCGEVVRESAWTIAVPLGLIGAAGFALVKGARGTWDQDIPEGDTVGPPRRD